MQLKTLIFLTIGMVIMMSNAFGFIDFDEMFEELKPVYDDFKKEVTYDELPEFIQMFLAFSQIARLCKIVQNVSVELLEEKDIGDNDG